MLPEHETPELLSQRALALWRRLSRLYDDIDAALKDEAGGVDIGLLGRDIVGIEAELRPVVAQLAEVRGNLPNPSDALRENWSACDSLVAALRERQPGLTRAAIAARDGTSRAIATFRARRRDTGAYRDQGAAEPRFASRQA